MKSLVQADTMLVYPDHNKSFHNETDASDFQVGAVIKQENKPVAFYTCKLKPTQKNYTTIEKELLSIVETLKEFRSMLFGAELNVRTNHKSLTRKLFLYKTTSTPLASPPCGIKFNLYLHSRTQKHCCWRTFTYNNVQHIFLCNTRTTTIHFYSNG